MRTRQLAFSVAALLMLAALPTLAGPRTQAAPERAQQRGMTEQQMTERCKKAMAEHEQMMSRMKAADAELEKLVARMNAAEGNEKVDAIAAVVNKIVEQRQSLRTHMMRMHEHMMGHMMEHMQMGDMQTMQRSMEMCPMMKGMMSPQQPR